MAKLEDEVEEEKLNLILGKNSRPTPEGRRALARWATKTAAVHSLLHRDDQPGFPTQHFPLLKTTNEPPPFTYVWFCECDFTHNTFTRYKRSLVGTSSEFSIYLTTISIGQAVFFILGTDNANAVEILAREVELRDTFSHRLWPINSTEPTERLIVKNEEEMISFSDLVFPAFQRMLMMQQ
ncbi:hypothetical protein QLG14_24235 [Pseudomonas sp. V104_10]|uniref:hypothetical protein n=1 Tax=Pseudomonas sp. V104_10 TaxID=3044231 RepID=UPI00249DBCDB|nr:hypothetical protein [Pseudomonas sp. V104_10]MDI3372340.1 hypothetical protein [Pseudomonas sp. V104_10]